LRNFIYIIRCSDGTLYTGYTTEPERRLEEHNAGKGSKYTRSRLPVELAYLEPSPSRASALRREFEIKRMSRGAKLRLCERYNREKGNSLR
jgi:putative endonuclease